jgi:hypothetical protein
MTYISKSVKFINKNDLLLSSLKKYYKTNDNFSKIVKILNNEANISLRIIDWFVTNYSKKNNIIYEICIDSSGLKYYLNDKLRKSIKKQLDNECHTLYKQFIVFLNYKSQLKAYSKKQFDPFCRRERIEFTINNSSEKIITTIGQLNFFKWAIDNFIIEYISDNIETIENDMNSSISDEGKNKFKKKRKRRSRNKKSSKVKVKVKESKVKESKVKESKVKESKVKESKVKESSTKCKDNIKVKKNVKNKNSKRKKRNELSVSASRGLNKHNVRTILVFN